MAQVSLDIFDIIAGLQRIDGKAVSQIVKTIVGQFSPLQDLFVMLDDCPLDKIFAELCGEHEIVGVVPLLAQHGAVVILFFFFLLQCIHHNGRYRKGSGIAVLRRAEEVFTVLMLQLTVYGDDHTIKVYIFPGQTQKLALPHTGKDGGNKQVAVVIFLSCCDQPGDLFRLQRMDGRFLDLWELAGTGRVVLDEFIFHSLV